LPETKAFHKTMTKKFPSSDKAPQSRCRFAITVADITPPLEIYYRMWGAAKHDRATGVHRPLRASVAVFAPPHGEDVKSIAQVVVALDHCVMGVVEHRSLVDRVAAMSGVQSEQVLVVFSHTHGAGLMGLDRVNLPGGEHIPAYLQKLGYTCGRLASDALAQIRPAWAVYGNGRCSLARYRDYFDAERGEYVVGFTPEHPADDTLVVARFTDDSGDLLATLVNYACHPTTLAWENTLISPDFVGAMREVVERTWKAPCLFLQGASGELGPREGFVGNVEVADRNGRQLGFSALAALESLPAAGVEFFYKGAVVSGATLGVWEYRPLGADVVQRLEQWCRDRWEEPLAYRRDLGTAESTAAERAALQEKERAARGQGREQEAADLRAMVERKTRLLHRLEQLPAGSHFPLQVVYWRMGDAVWLGVQGEHYSLLQIELRRRFPDRVLVVATIAADWGASYLPPREIYGAGIYQERIAVVEAGSLELLIESISRRLSS
jgi:hypothetical protein